MRSTTTGIFRERDDFAAALREDGSGSLIVTDNGTFQARLTRIALRQMRLIIVQELLARVLLYCVPLNVALVSVSIGRTLPQIWGGTDPAAGEIVTVGAGHRTYVRSVGHSHWGALLLPTRFLSSHAQLLTGSAVEVPAGVSHWRPSAKASRHLIRLLTSVARVAQRRADVIATSEAARTLEEELIDAAIACLSEAPVKISSDTTDRHTHIMGRFEDLLQAHPEKAFTTAELSEALGVSGRTLRTCCGDHLGMGPNEYIYLRRLHILRRELRSADAATANVADLAKQYGFGEAGRVAGDYRKRFGELPSVTLRQSAGGSSVVSRNSSQ
jgi:AraC-like DNA-binding protein